MFKIQPYVLLALLKLLLTHPSISILLVACIGHTPGTSTPPSTPPRRYKENRPFTVKRRKEDN